MKKKIATLAIAFALSGCENITLARRANKPIVYSFAEHSCVATDDKLDYWKGRFSGKVQSKILLDYEKGETEAPYFRDVLKVAKAGYPIYVFSKESPRMPTGVVNFKKLDKIEDISALSQELKDDVYYLIFTTRQTEDKGAIVRIRFDRQQFSRDNPEMQFQAIDQEICFVEVQDRVQVMKNFYRHRLPIYL